MPRALAHTLPRLFSLGLLALLAACAQQREPGFYDVGRDDTVSDARHRAQGDAGTVAPAQLQFGFGANDQKPAPADGAANAQPAVSGSAAGTAPAAPATPTGQPSLVNAPQALKETRTYLGTVACPASGQACPPHRMTVTLAPDGQWRARSATLDGTSATTALGCWHLVSTDPVRIVLQSGDQARATLEFIQSNVMRLTQIDGQTPLLESRLTRQADIDPIQELAAKPAESCAAH